jgi:hypothetical protein
MYDTFGIEKPTMFDPSSPIRRGTYLFGILHYGTYVIGDSTIPLSSRRSDLDYGFVLFISPSEIKSVRNHMRNHWPELWSHYDGKYDHLKVGHN